MARVLWSALVLVMFLAGGSVAPRWIAFAQQAAVPRQGGRLESVSIKVGDPESRQGGVFFTGDRFTARNVSVRGLIGFAYDVPEYQVSEAPQPLESARFDIEAKMGAESPDPTSLLVAGERFSLKSLLADRFKLKVHLGPRQEQIFELVAASGGPKLRPAADTSESASRVILGRMGAVRATAASMEQLTKLLTMNLRRVVVDKTGLNGAYDFTMNWPVGQGAALRDAVEEQLGLKLQPAMGQVDMLVIDHVEKPDAN
jgi:uncharacterized protein (TIGR03435 family)